MTTYELLVIVHSWLRWAVLLAAILALVRRDDASGRWFVIGMDVQVLIGLVLYLFLSPYTMSAWSNMAEAMGNSVTRFFAVEHLFGMLVATALAHVGRVKIRKATDPARRSRLTLIFYGLALVIMLLSIPWPMMPAGRPLFRPF